MKFMSKDFLLSSETARTLYHDFAESMPIVDYHCHINPQEIAEDRRFDNITQVWLGGDHYKWRQMRSNGVDEFYITGAADDREKFRAWAATLEKAIGNPLYHWSHLELQRYFNVFEPLTSDNADKIYDLCNKQLRNESMSVRKIILKSDVKIICTTDDPIDSLIWHQKLAADKSFPVKVLPAWRPDKAMNIEKDEFTGYIEKLATASSMKIDSFDALKKALSNRMEFFQSCGCKVSDHGINYVTYQPADTATIEAIFQKRLAGTAVSLMEELQFKTAFMVYMGREYNRLGWILQLHYGTKRSNNIKMLKQIGPDTGYDCINNYAPAAELADYLNALNETDELPKTILYSLNPNDNAIIGTIIGCFQSGKTAGKIQHGSAWWFNDHKTGMTEQMISLANLGLLANFIGMLTDSRSFLSYTRHEYFRRILCELIGQFVENGEYPENIPFLGKMVQDISYNNCIRYFEF